MSRRPYRVEVSIPTTGKAKYFLVKESQIEGQRVKVKKFLCSGNPPSAEELENYRRLYAFDLELKAAKQFSNIITTNFKTEHLTNDQVNEIEVIRFLYKSVRDSFTKQELEAYERDFEINYIQGTTSIEGNTFSLKETKDLIFNKITPKGKSLREINEIQNFRNVKKYRESYSGKVTIDFVKSMHAIIMHNIDDDSAGYFRRADNVGIVGYDYPLTPAVEINRELTKILDFYDEKIKSRYHPFEEAVTFHYFFETIHPFVDGNGRVGRETFNFMLARYKYPKFVFPSRDRDRYIQALKLGNEGRYSEMVTYFADIIIEQNLNLLKDTIRKLIEMPIKSGQTRLTEFF
jgi:Fic family protein